MRFKIVEKFSEDGVKKYYYPALESDNFENGYAPKISKYLGIEFNKYIKIMIKYGAHTVISLRKQTRTAISYNFDNLKYCEKFIKSKELEPYLIMEKLTT